MPEKTMFAAALSLFWQNFLLPPLIFRLNWQTWSKQNEIKNQNDVTIFGIANCLSNSRMYNHPNGNRGWIGQLSQFILCHVSKRSRGEIMFLCISMFFDFQISNVGKNPRIIRPGKASWPACNPGIERKYRIHQIIIL